jgi:hypothetical protein
MRKLLMILVLALLVIGAVSGLSATADSYCASSGLVINGEPWLSHEMCVPCPTGPHCPGLPGIPGGPGDPDDPHHK